MKTRSAVSRSFDLRAAYELAKAYCGIQHAFAIMAAGGRSVPWGGPAPVESWVSSRFGFFGRDLCHKTKPSRHNYSEMECQCETTSVEGFVQLIACNLLPHGYWFYVTGWVPEGKDPRRIDQKLTSKYGANLGRPVRARRKRQGMANLRYVRHGRFFVLLATRGQHVFFEEEAVSIRDIRRVPLKFAGYWISYRRGQRQRQGTRDSAWHSHVQIERNHYNDLKAYFLELALHKSLAGLAREFYQLPFEPYAPVRRQLMNILRAVNRERKRAKFQPLPFQVLPLRRRVVKPFEPAPGRVARLVAAEGRPGVGPE